MFNMLLVASLAVFTGGLLYKTAGWFSRQVGLWPTGSTPWQRLWAFAGALLATISSIQSWRRLGRAGWQEVLAQRHILDREGLRWLMHLLIFIPFVWLLLMHGLDQMVTARLFSGYLSTLNPWFFLRDLAGVLVLGGLFLAVWRRYLKKIPWLISAGADHYALILLAVIIASGFMLQSLKMVSPHEFEDMIYEYSMIDDPEDMEALEAFWVQEYGLFSARRSWPLDMDQVAQGEDIHAMECAGCHPPAPTAFASFNLGKLLHPVVPFVERHGMISLLYWLHVLACFTGLALLPFTKMLHIITTPITLLVRAVMGEATAHPLNIATRQALELDACTHCSTCSRHCSVRNMAGILNNPLILPGEKMALLKTADPARLSASTLQALRQGVYLCTNCDRCTINCPAGINLRELWWHVREKLVRLDGVEPLMLSPLSLLRSLRREHRLMDDGYDPPLKKAFQALTPLLPQTAAADPLKLPLQTPRPSTLQPTTSFQGCFSCCNCTTVCPVVRACAAPEAELGLLPHQIMNCLALGLNDMAASAAMLYCCTTCYQCQEHCPQQVAVTDILYHLKQQHSA